MLRLSLGATRLLSTKIAEEQNMFRKLKSIIKESKTKKKIIIIT